MTCGYLVQLVDSWIVTARQASLSMGKGIRNHHLLLIIVDSIPLHSEVIHPSFSKFFCLSALFDDIPMFLHCTPNSAGWIQYCAVLPSCSATSILWFLVSSTPKLASKKNRSNAGKSMNIPIFTGWWFGTFFIFHNIWDNPSHWLIFFRGVKTTNQFRMKTCDPRWISFRNHFRALAPSPASSWTYRARMRSATAGCPFRVWQTSWKPEKYLW